MNTLLAALTALPGDTHRLVVGFSGGRDSASLLHAARRVWPVERLAAWHICHHLDEAALDWAEFCRRCCAEHGIAYTGFNVSVDTADGGLEAAARQARYACVAQQLVAGDVFVTAHHADDQAETVLIQALRGAGMRGLAAMPALAPLGDGRIWRPWLTIGCDSIAAYAQTEDVAWVDDPSNHDTDRARGYIGAHLWPQIATRWPSAASALARVAQRAAEAREAIDSLAELDLAHVRNLGAPATLGLSKLIELSPARQGEVVMRWLGEAGAATPDHRHVAQILGLSRVREHNSPRVIFARTEVRRFDGRLFVMPRSTSPPSTERRIPWPLPEQLPLPAGAGWLSVQYTDTSTTWPDALEIGFRRGGERIVRPDGRPLALKDWLQIQRVPPWIRERMPLVYHGNTLIAVADRWRHPAWRQWFDGASPQLCWQHDLVGDTQARCR